jgi:hypothetical protein
MGLVERRRLIKIDHSRRVAMFASAAPSQSGERRKVHLQNGGRAHPVSVIIRARAILL